MLANRANQLSLDLDALLSEEPGPDKAPAEEEISIDWALEEIRKLFEPEVSPLAVPDGLSKGKGSKTDMPRPRYLVRNQTPITSLSDVEWLEQLGAELLQQVLYGYELHLLVAPCKIRLSTPSTDPDIQAVWAEMAELLEWSDQGIEQLCYSLVDYQLDMLEKAQNVHYGRDGNLGEEVRDIWNWINETGPYAGKHSLPFSELAKLSGCDGDELAKGLWARLPAFVEQELQQEQKRVA